MKTLEKTSLFWDVDAAELDKEKHARFIIERVLSRGDVEDFHWAKKFYGEEKLREVFLESRPLDERSENFWCQYFKIDEETCTKRRSMKKHEPFWQR